MPIVESISVLVFYSIENGTELRHSLVEKSHKTKRVLILLSGTNVKHIIYLYLTYSLSHFLTTSSNVYL